MQKQGIKNILDRYHRGKCTAEEKLQVELWYFQQSGSSEWQLQNVEMEPSRLRIWNQLNKRIDLLPEKSRKLKVFWSRIAVAAAAVAAIIVVVYFFTPSYQHAGNTAAEGMLVNDILPGRTTAKLTFMDGKAVMLSDNKSAVIIDAASLKYNDGSPVQGSNGRKGGVSPQTKEQLTITTPRGGTYQVILPDGSRVWLNAASSLTFPSSFRSAAQRKVELAGEAYFEISKNKKQPFLVKSKNQLVTVLGTHFNVNSYTDEKNVKTTLLEGSVRVVGIKSTNGPEMAETVLKPGQQATLTEAGIKVNKANTEEALAWKNGYFVFINEDIRSIMRKISRWYNVDVVYEGKIENKAIWGSVSRFSNVSQVLDMLSATKTVKFKIDGKKIIVLPTDQ